MVPVDTKISLVGVGSASFGLRTLYDITSSPLLKGCEVALTDIDESKLSMMKKVAVSLNKHFESKLKIESTTSIREGVRDADFVLIAADIQYMRRWKMNFEIPFKHGIKHVIGSCVGPGGLAHTLITVPLVLDICNYIQDESKDAVVLNYTNPESRVVRAISEYTKIKAYGLCPGIYERLETLATLLGLQTSDFVPFAAGLNHFTWLLKLRLKENGKDAYPLVDEKLKSSLDFEPLSTELYHIFGFYPSPGDTLTGEYIPYAWDIIPDAKRGLNHIRSIEQRGLGYNEIVESLARGDPPPQQFSKQMTSAGIRIVNAMLDGGLHEEFSINIPNQGCIQNIPSDAVVEIPATVDATGIRGVSVGSLPQGIAAMCNHQGAIQELAVDAAYEGSYEKALEAMILDPLVSSPKQARETLDDLLASHREVLPRFGLIPS
jgi:alpha-galactosidase